MFRTHALLLLSVLVLSLLGCDNVGRAFDPSIEPPPPPPGSAVSTIQVLPRGGDARDGRPRVKAVFPTGGGWPTTVPVVVEFNESLNAESILPTSGTANDARVFVRVKGQTQALPALYEFVAANKVLVIRPTSLTNQQNPTYEVVMLPEGRDADGVRFSVPTEGSVLGEFQVNQAESFVDGRIMTTFPRDNQTDGTRETSYYVFFDRPANLATLTETSFFVRQSGGTALPGTTEVPLSILGNDDTRFVRFTPTAPLAASTEYELVVDDTITFGAEGVLDFRNRTPYSSFRTVGPRAPLGVHVGNPTLGYDDRINRNNVGNLVLRVTTPADAEVGDVCVARVYGGDKATTATGDLVFFQASTTLSAAGQQDVDVDFTGLLGTVERPKLDDGAVDFVVQMQRGSEHSGAITNAASAEPVFDVTPPTLVAIGPPGSIAANEIYTDQEALVFFGTASERLGAVTFADGVNPTVEMFASSADGRFAVKYVPLGRLTTPRSYSLLLTDFAGNLAVAPYTGTVVQRGVVTGAFAGTLVVEAYDDTTLLPIADATVLVDTDTPTVPATAQATGTTDATGRATFPGLAGTFRTVTIVRAGYHLVTFCDTAAAFVSLPLRPLENATATFAGSALFQQTLGTTALVGNNCYDDPLVLEVPTTSAASTTIPPTAIRPNRPQVITAFAGAFSTVSTPDYALQGFQMLGATLTSPTPPAAPAAPGSTSNQNVVLLPTAGLIGQLEPDLAKDFALAAGLDTGNLVGGQPVVSALASMEGFGGQVLAGVGHATLVAGASYTWSATYGTPLTVGLSPFVPTLWGAIEARDTGGRVSRTRALLFYLVTGQPVFDPAPAPSIPTIQVPGGPSTGSPAVTCDDTLATATVGAALAMLEIVARDGNNRQWFLYRMDRDGAGGTDTVQFPDLATANVAGLTAGTWSVRAEGRVLLQLVNGATADDFVFAERQRMEVTYARSAPVSFTIQ